MTSLNFCFNERRLFVVTDSSASCPVDHHRVGSATKLFAVPHLRLIIAGHGTHLVLANFATHACFASTAKNVLELAESAPSVLRETWAQLTPARRFGEHSSAILIAGFDDTERMRVFYLSHRVSFEPAVLRSGVYLSPALKPEIEQITATEPPAADTAIDAPSSPAAPPPPAEPWAQQTRRVASAVRTQQAEQPAGFIGGRVWGCLLTFDSIYQSELDDLDAVEEAEA